MLVTFEKRLVAKKPTENKKIFVTINPPNINEIKFFSSTNKNGPGTTPLLIINPINIAAAPDPGIPNARVGIRVPATTELLAVSGAAIPSSTPVPNFSPIFDHFFLVYKQSWTL